MNVQQKFDNSRCSRTQVVVTSNIYFETFLTLSSLKGRIYDTESYNILNTRQPPVKKCPFKVAHRSAVVKFARYINVQWTVLYSVVHLNDIPLTFPPPPPATTT